MDNHIGLKLISMDDMIRADCVDFDFIIETMEDVFADYANGKVMLPDKTSMIFDQTTQNRINCMPSTLLEKGVCGVKWVSVFPENPHKYGTPNVSAVIVLSELEKGYPFAIMDGTLITALRTACMGAIGAKYLARKDSRVYGTIGTGEQAKMHFRFIKHVIPSIKICNVACKTVKSGEEFISEMEAAYPDVEFCKCNSDYRKASIDSDIIVTAVSCQKPLLKCDAIKLGAYYCHVGGWEDEYEVPLKADKIVCDSWHAVKHRGSPTIAKLFAQGRLKDEDIYGDIVELIDGSKPGRENDQEFIYFNAVGLSFEDVAVAYSFYKKIMDKGRGLDWSL